MSEIALELGENIEKLLVKMQELKNENSSLKDDLKAKEEEIDNFQKSAKITNIVNGINTDGMDADALKTRIDENIQALDNCIAQLSSK